MGNPINAAPMVDDLGTEDLSTRRVPREPEAIPQHLPVYFLFTQKGPLTKQLVSGAERINMYGQPSFDENGKWTNYSTIFSNGTNEEGNAQMIVRLIAENAGPNANFIIYADVLPTKVDDYTRNIDGSIKTDVGGNPVIAGQIDGYKVKYVVKTRSTHADLAEFGQATIIAGDQHDVVTNVQSQRFPIFEMRASSQGEYYNSCGLRLWAPTAKSMAVLPTKMMDTHKAYPYFVQTIRKPDALSAPKVVKTLFGEEKIMVTFKENVIDPLTTARLNVVEKLIPSYENLTDPKYPAVHGDFDQFYVYQENLDALLTMFHAAEVPYIDGFSDFTSDTDDKHLFNFVGGVSSNNVPYHSFVFVDAADTVRFTEYTNIYAASGSDGDTDNETYARLVKNYMDRYLDSNDELMDLAYHVESVIYDTGFPLDTKLALMNFMAVRKDTLVVVGTHDVNDRTLGASEELSVAIALRTRAAMFPESDYFGTEVTRAAIFGCSGKIRNSQYVKRLPLTYEYMRKAAKYMGAGNGRWKNGFHYDGAPGCIIEKMYDINLTWVPKTVRNRFWDAGLNWVQRYDRSSFQFPAYKTVYSNDTSVLTSITVCFAIAQLNKVAHAVWREFVGVDHLSPAQLVDAVNAEVEKRCKDRFDGRFKIVPACTLTDADMLRGYAWTLPIKIYANNMKTFMTTYVQAYRMTDLDK